MSGWVASERQREREAYRRSRAARSRWVAGTLTVALVAGVLAVLVSSPGWPAVQQSFLSPHWAWTSLPDVADGLWLNVRIMVCCEVVILALGLTLALMRTLQGPVAFPLRLFATAYTDLFRGLPLILVLLLLGLGVPALRLTGVTDSVVFWGSAALVLTYSAYVAEVFRAGIESVHPSQRMAARSLGLSYAQSLRHVVLPQAVRRVVPPLLNDLVSLQKDSGLVSVLGVTDAVQAASIINGRTFNFTPYVVAGALFVALTIPMTRLTDWLAARSQGGVRSTGGPL
ncbi:amino acid ABC transporter membrane protein (PAAT family) [Motilibacter rhizosphaerae]|uniref:Amino acid ABC transporter membrane protein (PAAT family) n=1 Tax=Motilibacter rhizosphaerae TaxID=598652 RepID=A0A4Q7NT33_9ACTN|nr:amino acid ABC transporter permease [Motilibacter rhizosphaerae]RZS90154.1 amino acid ABC transporter membrane protein (PAAT family) [Motilibacter rhizosphaerae]